MTRATPITLTVCLGLVVVLASLPGRVGRAFSLHPSVLFPQIASGQGFVAEVIVKNHSDEAVAGTLTLRQKTGQALLMELDGTVSDSFPFELPPRGVIRMESGDAGAVQAGYALIEAEPAEASISGSVVYRFGGSEVSVSPAQPAAGYAGFVQQVRSSDPNDDTAVRTGIALVNPTDGPVLLQLALLDSEGALVASAEQPLQAGEHLALFVDELFADYFAPGGGAGDLFEGSLEVAANTGSFSMTVLRMRFPSGRIANLGSRPIDPMFAFVGVTVAPMTGEGPVSRSFFIVSGAPARMPRLLAKMAARFSSRSGGQRGADSGQRSVGRPT